MKTFFKIVSIISFTIIYLLITLGLKNIFLLPGLFSSFVYTREFGEGGQIVGLIVLFLLLIFISLIFLSFFLINEGLFTKKFKKVIWGILILGVTTLITHFLLSGS